METNHVGIRRVAMPVRDVVLAACLLAAAGLGFAESSAVVKTVFPDETDAPLSNPYMGWGLWAGPRYFDGTPLSLEYNTSGFGGDAPLFGWVLIDWMWSDLEPQENNCNCLPRPSFAWAALRGPLKISLDKSSDFG